MAGVRLFRSVANFTYGGPESASKSPTFRILTVIGHLTEPISYKIGSYRIIAIGYLSSKNES